MSKGKPSGAPHDGVCLGQSWGNSWVPQPRTLEAFEASTIYDPYCSHSQTLTQHAPPHARTNQMAPEHMTPPMVLSAPNTVCPTVMTVATPLITPI